LDESANEDSRRESFTDVAAAGANLASAALNPLDIFGGIDQCQEIRRGLDRLMDGAFKNMDGPVAYGEFKIEKPSGVLGPSRFSSQGHIREAVGIISAVKNRNGDTPISYGVIFLDDQSLPRAVSTKFRMEILLRAKPAYRQLAPLSAKLDKILLFSKNNKNLSIIYLLFFRIKLARQNLVQRSVYGVPQRGAVANCSDQL
jgi:hypothetical protein